MTTKQLKGLYAPDGSKYGCVTDGSGSLVSISTSSSSTKQLRGAQAPDGSIYFCLTDGSGTLQ